MSTKLSDELKDLAGHPDALVAYYASCYGDRVRTLEERVAELEVGVQSERENFWAHDELLQAAIARAEAAETEVARLRGGVIGEEYRAQILANDFNRARNERDALRAKLEKARPLVRRAELNCQDDHITNDLAKASAILDGEDDA